MRSPRALVTGVLLVALFATAAIGQDARAWRDSAQRIHALASALRDSMVRGDSTTEEVGRLGNFAIAASPKDRTVAAEALRQFTEVSDHWFGGALPSPGGFRLVVHTETATGVGFGNPREFGAVVLSGLPDTDSASRMQQTRPPGDVTKTLIDGYGGMMLTSTTASTLWVGSSPTLSTLDGEGRQMAMYALVTGTDPKQRACVGGDLRACAAAFALDASSAGDNGSAFSTFMRSDLFFATLSVGGRGAWSRFVGAANSGIRPALVAAAAMPLDSLLARWRGGLLALRPTEGPIRGPVALAALFWTAAVLAGALGASRWA